MKKIRQIIINFLDKVLYRIYYITQKNPEYQPMSKHERIMLLITIASILLLTIVINIVFILKSDNSGFQFILTDYMLYFYYIFTIFYIILFIICVVFLIKEYKKGGNLKK